MPKDNVLRGQITPQFVLQEATVKDYPTIQNMARFYVYDLSRYCEWSIPQDGLFESFNFKSYFEDSDRLALIIKVKEELAGFVLINSVTELPDTQWNIGEFFILAKFQERKLGTQVTKELWKRYPGKWEVSVIPENQPAYQFWKNSLKSFDVKEDIIEVDYDKEQSKRILFSFSTDV